MGVGSPRGGRGVDQPKRAGRPDRPYGLPGTLLPNANDRSDGPQTTRTGGLPEETPTAGRLAKTIAYDHDPPHYGQGHESVPSWLAPWTRRERLAHRGDHACSSQAKRQPGGVNAKRVLVVQGGQSDTLGPRTQSEPRARPSIKARGGPLQPKQIWVDPGCGGHDVPSVASSMNLARSNPGAAEASSSANDSATWKMPRSSLSALTASASRSSRRRTRAISCLWSCSCACRVMLASVRLILLNERR